eukprot:1992652-Rhodomonas_salina.2
MRCIRAEDNHWQHSLQEILPRSVINAIPCGVAAGEAAAGERYWRLVAIRAGPMSVPGITSQRLSPTLELTDLTGMSRFSCEGRFGAGSDAGTRGAGSTEATTGCVPWLCRKSSLSIVFCKKHIRVREHWQHNDNRSERSSAVSPPREIRAYKKGNRDSRSGRKLVLLLQSLTI